MKLSDSVEPKVWRIVVRFFALLIFNFGILLAYKTAYVYWSNEPFSADQTIIKMVPYVVSAGGEAFGTKAIYILVYYATAVSSILMYIIISVVDRAQPIEIKKVVLSTAVMVIISLPWLYGLDLRTIKMSGLHHGQILGHILFTPLLIGVIGLACYGAYGPLRDDGKGKI